MDFVNENVIWFIIGGTILFMALIGFIAEKTDFGRKPKKVKEEPKEVLASVVAPIVEEVVIAPKEEIKVENVIPTVEDLMNNEEPKMDSPELPTLEEVNTELTMEPLLGEVISESVIEEPTLETVTEEVITEPVIEEPSLELAGEIVPEEITTEPMLETVTEEIPADLVLNQKGEEPTLEEVISEPTLESVTEEVITEPTLESVTEEVISEPVVEEAKEEFQLPTLEEVLAENETYKNQEVSEPEEQEEVNEDSLWKF
jgi:hypothetical protein